MHKYDRINTLFSRAQTPYPINTARSREGEITVEPPTLPLLWQLFPASRLSFGLVI